MIEFVREPFDSGLWKKEVYKFHVQPPFPNVLELREAIAKTRPDLLFAFVPFSPHIMETMEDVGFHLISIRSTYKLGIDAAKDAPPLPSGMRTVSLKDGFKVSDQDLHEMAVTIGSVSRYFRDRRIPPHQALELYLTWIKNSLFNGYVQEAFLVLNDTRMVGLVTLKIKEGCGSIDLIGVSPSFQRSGIGSRLLWEAFHYFQSNGIKDIYVVTEGENISANAFYQRKGFLLHDLALVYHMHPTYE